MKICNVCRETKIPEDFYRNKAAPDGRNWTCKSCEKKRNRSAYHKKYDTEQRDLVAKAANDKRYRETHVDEIKLQKAESYKANPEPTKERVRQWRANNPEEKRAQARREQAARRAAGQPFWGTVEWEAERLIILERDDGLCGICGHDINPFNFHIDHIVPISRGGPHELENLQLAHDVCNSRKYTSVL